jgi:SAM-dependent methyltransferase
MAARESATGYPVVEWLSDVARLKYADYWNDESEERRKPLWIVDGNFHPLEEYLAQIRLPDQLRACIACARERFGRVLNGIGVDLGAGNLWAAPYLLALGSVERLYCVEYSKHRLLDMGPALLAHYGVSPGRVVLALGDLHRLEIGDGTLDFVFMSAAFHHSDRPQQLLGEIRRVLKPTGLVMLIGEHITDAGGGAVIRHMVKFCVARLLPRVVQRRVLGRELHVERLLPSEEDLLAGDERLGDHAYTHTRYQQMFAAAGFEGECLRRREWPYQAFVLVPTGI